MVFPSTYHSDHPENTQWYDESVGNKNKITRLFHNGKKELLFQNGVKKQIFPDGYTIVFFNNKDIKQTYPDGKSVYYFSEADTTQTTMVDGTKVFRFDTGQIEIHYNDKTIECRFVDGTVQNIDQNGQKTVTTPDGVTQIIRS